jgi:hypothetical protein
VLLLIAQALDLSYVYEIGTIAGIAILIFCIYLTEKIIRLFPGGNIVKKWRIMEILIVIFIILYILDWYIWLYDLHDLIFIIGGILRVGTAILFGLILFLFYRTTQIVLKRKTK